MPRSDKESVYRQWLLLRLIPRYPVKVTARFLQEKLGDEGMVVSKRTIERDLIALSGLFPLVADDREKPFGWSWQKDAPSFDLPGLSSTEALAMKLVEEYLRPLLPASITDQLKPHFRAADEALRKSPNSARAAAWTRKIHIVPPAQPLLPPAIKAEVQRNAYEALLQDRRVEAIYLRRGDAMPVKYTLHPLAVVQRGAVTYLVATIFDYKDVHLFALHRFQNVSMLDEPVHRPPGFDLGEYVAAGAFGFGNGKTIRLQALFTHDAAEHLHETPLSADQTLKLQDNEHAKVTATVADTPQLRWWLLGFGDAVEVLAPAALRSLMASTTLKMSQRYRSK